MPPNKNGNIDLPEFFITVSYGKYVPLFTKCCLSHCLKHEYSSCGACYGQIYFASLHLQVLQTLGQLPSLPWQCLVIRNLIKADTTLHVKELNEVKWHQWALYSLRLYSCFDVTFIHTCVYVNMSSWFTLSFVSAGLE